MSALINKCFIDILKIKCIYLVFYNQNISISNINEQNIVMNYFHDRQELFI